MMTMRVEYELDQWEWQGTTRSIEINPEDYAGMSEGAIKELIYTAIKRDAEQNLHLVYGEDETVQEILRALEANNDDTD